MAQKSNPNSFHKTKKSTVFFGSSFHLSEYSSLLKEYLTISTNLITFFEKNSCLVKDCFFSLNNEKSFVTLFISFLVLKRQQKTKQNTISVNSKLTDISLVAQNFFRILSKFGYISSKRLILQNLNKVALKYQKTFFSNEHFQAKKELFFFSKEIYYESGIFLFCLMNTTKNTSSLISKFIAKFFKIFHRTKKLNKFLLFLSKFVEMTHIIGFKGQIKGLKIQISGRFKGVPRTKTRIFEKGRIPLQTISNNINYSLTHVHTSYGVFGIKVWIFE
jgi:hypothetical protein